jgi:murein DD-endopeptidase MepM/ murein hydrolase activator NlpD
MLTLFLTLWIEGMIGKYGLPFLSLSFLMGTWLVSLASRQFTHLAVSERGIYMANEMFALGGLKMVGIYSWFNNLGIPDPLRLYFKSLGAIFFQYNLLAGILIAAGLLIHSRISFVLSLLGFFSAYLYYQLVGANIHELSYSYIGFNFILTSIAIGGFFIIPSRWSFLWVILLTPLISIILIASGVIFSTFQLSVYSLPFNIVVLIFLYSLKFRERFFDKPELVVYQQYSPEKNLYSQLNYKSRFGKSLYFSFILPFWDEWKVTQGQDGKFTHKDEWRHAWDLEIVNDKGKSYEEPGTRPEDYFCFNKPVTAPADGWVEEVVNDIGDNEIGKIDMDNNWGNTVVIRHADQLYSKLSHLKKDSIKVATGDPVKKGQVLAYCGNSGRSPVPHLHFQIQATPYIGSKTIEYPLSHYIRHKKGIFQLISYEIPEEDTEVSNIHKNSSLSKAFRFIPGQKFSYLVKTTGKKEYKVQWEVLADSLNNTFIFCEKTGSKAWFKNDGDIHYFTHFEGDRSSLLFRFYLGAYKIMMGYYRNLQVSDTFPVNTFNNKLVAIIQDFISPFWFFIRSEYSLEYLGMDDELRQTDIRLRSEASVLIGSHILKKFGFELFVNASGLKHFSISENERMTEVINVSEG